VSPQEQFIYLLNNPWNEEQLQFNLFANALKDIQQLTPNDPCMLELGSSGIDGSLYSILFEKFFNYQCRIINTEPRDYLLDWVKVAWKDKHLINANLVHCFTGTVKDVCGVHENQKFVLEETPQYSVAQLMDMYSFNKLHMLHCDIQGAEINALKEIIDDGVFDNIMYFFISLHNTHTECLNLLNGLNIEMIFNHPFQGGHGDGLLAFKNLNFSI
jgi:hypothetical protein